MHGVQQTVAQVVEEARCSGHLERTCSGCFPAAYALDTGCKAPACCKFYGQCVLRVQLAGPVHGISCQECAASTLCADCLGRSCLKATGSAAKSSASVIPAKYYTRKLSSSGSRRAAAFFASANPRAAWDTQDGCNMHAASAFCSSAAASFRAPSTPWCWPHIEHSSRLSQRRLCFQRLRRRG